MNTLSIIGLTIGIGIFVALVMASILISLQVNPFRTILRPEVSWIIILLLQAIYLSMDIAETVTKRELFGLLAAGFMISLGFLILFLTWYENEKRNLPQIIEGLFYLVIGAVLLTIRLSNT